MPFDVGLIGQRSRTSGPAGRKRQGSASNSGCAEGGPGGRWEARRPPRSEKAAGQFVTPSSVRLRAGSVLPQPQFVFKRRGAALGSGLSRAAGR